MDMSQLIAGFSGGGGGGGGGGAAAAGLAAAGPYGAAIGAVAGALSTPTSSGVSGDERNSFFSNAGSGWNVATGGSTSRGEFAASANNPASPYEAAYGVPQPLSAQSGTLLLAGAAIVAVVLLTRRKG